MTHFRLQRAVRSRMTLRGRGTRSLCHPGFGFLDEPPCVPTVDASRQLLAMGPRGNGPGPAEWFASGPDFDIVAPLYPEEAQMAPSKNRRLAGTALAGPLLAAVLAVMAGTTACKKKEEAPPPPPPTVEVATVTQKDVPVYSEW